MSAFTQFTKMYENKEPVSQKTIQIAAAKEEERKIAAMGLGELKNYACPKALQHNKDWYMTCVSCNGCKIGRRVTEILENDTKPDEKVSQIDKFNARIEKSNGGNNRYPLVGREGFSLAMQQPDPIAYLMAMNGCTNKAASHRLYKWRVAYPDIAEQYADNARHSNTIKSSTDGRITHNALVSEEAKQRFADAFEYPGGVYEYFRKVRGNTSGVNTIKQRVKELARKYPDIDEKYHISEWLEANKGVPGRRNNGVIPEENMVHLKYLKKEPVDDEVSVDDFLREMDEKNDEVIPEVIEKDTDTVEAEVEIPVVGKLAKQEDKKDILESKVSSDKQNRIAACLVFSEKRIEIVKSINEHKVMISKLQEEIDDLNDKLSKLDAAAEIMGFVVEK